MSLSIVTMYLFLEVGNSTIPDPVYVLLTRFPSWSNKNPMEFQNRTSPHPYRISRCFSHHPSLCPARIHLTRQSIQNSTSMPRTSEPGHCQLFPRGDRLGLPWSATSPCSNPDTRFSLARNLALWVRGRFLVDCGRPLCARRIRRANSLRRRLLRLCCLSMFSILFASCK